MTTTGLVLSEPASRLARREESPTVHELVLKAPLSGQLVPIEQVPDPVFAQKMVGDGIAIDPVIASLLAPCDGEVVMLHPGHHALTLKTAESLEVLMHIGLDTINLKGEGFIPKVENGDKVKAGMALTDFDADFVATHAKSLLSMIIVTNSDSARVGHRGSGNVVAGEDVVLKLELTPAASAGETASGASQRVTSEAILIPNKAGLHARPAAVLANLAKKHSSTIRLQRGEAKANAKSVTGLMNLDVRFNDEVNLVAQGRDAEAAVKVLSALILAGQGEEAASAPVRAGGAADLRPEPVPVRRSADPNLLLGVTASPGLAAGRVFQVRPQDLGRQALDGAGRGPALLRGLLWHLLRRDPLGLRAAGVNAVMRLPHHILHLIVGPNAGRYAAAIASTAGPFHSGSENSAAAPS